MRPDDSTSAPNRRIRATRVLGLALALLLAAGQARAACSVDYAVTSDWGSGFIASVAIHNDGTSAISGWTLGFAFGGSQSITSSWSAGTTQQGKIGRAHV